MQYVLRNAAKITYFVQTTSPFLWSEISGGKSPFASGLHRGQHSLCRLCVNGEEDVKENINDFTSQTYLYTSSTHDRQMPIAKDQTEIEAMRACQCLVQPRSLCVSTTWFFFNTIYKISQTRHCITLAVTTNSYRIEGAEHTFA